MPNYMVQNMSYKNSTSTYFRAQTCDHPSHVESGRFTDAAKAAYANSQRISPTVVVVGKYFSGQGRPLYGKEI